MNRRQHISWPDALDLRVVGTLAKLVNNRWHLGIDFTAADGSLVVIDETAPFWTHGRLCKILRDQDTRPNGCLKVGATVRQQLSKQDQARSIIHTCHIGLRKMAAPIVVEGSPLGFVLAGGYVNASNGDRSVIRTKLASLGVSEEQLDGLLEEIPVLSTAEETYLRELIEQLALEIAHFQAEAGTSERRLDGLEPLPKTRYSYSRIIGKSAPMQELYQLLDKVIDSDSTVLIHGENGTGKELIAKAIHYNSWRKARRFVVQNCSAFNDNLLDSELFGHKKGAFTGAICDKQGLFEVADGSTFFLDEIGDMSAALQVKLLRVLQEGTFIPVGDTQPKKVDVRIIAATNRDLKQMVQNTEFREDLYYRINVINIRIPPLRERKEDIPQLVDHFLTKQAGGNRARLKRLTKGCLRRLIEHNWPGNIRELENEIERLVVLTGDEKLVGEELLSSRIRQPELHDELGAGGDPTGLPDAIQKLERNMIYEVLKRNHWNKTRAAQDLHISRRNLIRKVTKYNLDQRRAR